MKHVVAIILFFLASVPVLAAGDETLTHTYVYKASPSESLEQAKRNAVNYAKVDALRNRYGSVLSGASATSLISKNNITESKFVSIGDEGEVNGEWIGDLEEPKISTELKEDVFFVTVTVKGKTREITNNPIGFEAKILRNTPDVAFESSEFVAGNDVFVHFTSPVDGFLAIYLMDGETVSCLLPYMADNDGMYPIEHGKDYVFFSRKKFNEGEDPNVIDEYVLTVDGGHQDLNQFYFIFSPNEFTKAEDKIRKTDDGTMFPRYLSWENFQKWIMRTRNKDRKMSVQTKFVVISPMN